MMTHCPASVCNSKIKQLSYKTERKMTMMVIVLLMTMMMMMMAVPMKMKKQQQKHISRKFKINQSGYRKGR